MTILISSFGGGGGKKTASIAGLTIPSGTSADFTISCPVGKYINITFLTSQNTQSGVSLSIGGNTVFSSFSVVGGTSNIGSAANSIKIGDTNANTAETTKGIMGGNSEDFVFSFDATTTFNIFIAYEVLEDA
ncbi:MAG: hypothetical protein HRU12_24880 [Phaeodactylibacter sp.]|nr:hypothetical protein [Phaeodactylibacter sp.]